MKRDDIIACAEDTERKLSAERLSGIALSKKQQARIKNLRWEAAEHMKRQQVSAGSRPARRAQRAAYGN